jgi:Lectin C-type domain
MRWAVVAIAATGCLKAAAFPCTSNEQCTKNGALGTCESVGFCSFPDGECASGRRFGSLSGTFANQCVGDGDAGVDSPFDAPIDMVVLPDGLGCPVGYATLTGVPTHAYRRIGTLTNWQNQVNACKADGANVYLVIPDDATELQAILTLAGGPTWVGVNDITTEGTFVTVLGGAATYLPWASGQPDNSGNQGGSDCVEALVGGTYDDKRCAATSLIAVCECEP